MQKNGFLKQFTIIGGGTFFNLLLGLFSTLLSAHWQISAVWQFFMLITFR